MNRPIPEFVFRMGAAEDEWVERDDRLIVENEILAFNERNQQDWWEQNRRIRLALAEAGKAVQNKIAHGEMPSKKTASWLQLARTLSCDRTTLKHPKRYYWINAWRTQILTLIEEFEQRYSKSKSIVEPEVPELDQLKLNLHAQRTQTALWYDKCLGLERKVLQLTRLLAIKNAKINSLLASGNAHTQQFK